MPSFTCSSSRYPEGNTVPCLHHEPPQISSSGYHAGTTPEHVLHTLSSLLVLSACESQYAKRREAVGRWVSIQQTSSIERQKLLDDSDRDDQNHRHQIH
jgi:hypothetical protein